MRDVAILYVIVKEAKGAVELAGHDLTLARGQAGLAPLDPGLRAGAHQEKVERRSIHLGEQIIIVRPSRVGKGKQDSIGAPA